MPTAGSRSSKVAAGERPSPATGQSAALFTAGGALALLAAAAWSAVIIAHYMPQCIPGAG